MTDDEITLPDRIDGIPHPAEHEALFGHLETFETIKQQFADGRFHHARFLIGPKGIGKASFAFRMASHMLGKTSANGLLAHPNLLYLTRPYGQKEKKFKTQVTVEEVRKIRGFLSTTREGDLWRVIIVDSIDEMNASSQNALLKVLEEPPSNTLFLLICHRADRALPTIRSRCQSHVLNPLNGEDLSAVLHSFDGLPEISEADIQLLGDLSDGSVRTALAIHLNGGLELNKEFQSILSKANNLDWAKVHGFAEKIALRSQGDLYRLFAHFAEQFLTHMATGKSPENHSSSVLARWVEVWEKTRESISEADSFNLDRKQVVLNFFHQVGQAARQ